MTHGLKNIERDCQRLFGLKSLGLRRQHLQRGFPGASGVKNLPAVQETRVQSLGWEDPLKESMATHSGILAWRIPCTEETGELQSVALLTDNERGTPNEKTVCSRAYRNY